ncbi:hypothetical protein DFH29DRAFT_875332 [Suillus ampliporus]|nr:hypothetical protein DFH29DRAFT_875332 [Suillus ampliporus]
MTVRMESHRRRMTHVEEDQEETSHGCKKTIHMAHTCVRQYQEASYIGTQGAGRKVAPKRKLDDRAGDASVASKRGRKIVVQPQTTGGFIKPFALAVLSTHLTKQQTEPVAHLVPPESIPPHPPQSFDAMLLQHQCYDAYMQPNSLNNHKVQELLEKSPQLSDSTNIQIDPAIMAPEDSSPQGQDSEVERMLLPPVDSHQSTQHRALTSIVWTSLRLIQQPGVICHTTKMLRISFTITNPDRIFARTINHVYNSK